MAFKPKFFVPMFLALVPVPAFAADFPSSCFVETTEFVPKQPGNVTVLTDLRDDLFFVQNGSVLPMAGKDVVKSADIPAKLVGPPDWDGAVFSNLSDASNDTYVEIPPAVRVKGKTVLEFDFGKTLPRGTFRLVSDILGGSHSVEVSPDGKTFVETDERSVSNFDARSVRLVFPAAPEQSSITTVRSFRFVAVAKDTLFIRAESASPIDAYRGYRCDPSRISAFRAERDAKFADVEKLKPSDKPSEPKFVPNARFDQDADGDGISDATDVCPGVPDATQADRNFDGRGDACSDDDHDGFVGSADNCPTVANSDQADLNRNGVGDACEFDSDKDGVPDGTDNAIHVANPDQKDSDGDGIGDVIDNCSLSNNDQLDLDKNGKGDVCDRDAEYRGTHDTDKDGRLDFEDNCPKVANADQKDSDGDGIGDSCDNCPALMNSDQKDSDSNGKGDMCEDADHDGIEGWRDNCPTVSNADQKDSNNDKIGDVCSDTDYDGVYDSQDDCPTAYDPKQEDVDGDKIGNACDPKDDRPLESNRTVFAVLAVLVALAFLTGIALLFRSMSKTPASK